MSEQRDLAPGYYWLQEIESGELDLAQWCGDYWNFMGTAYMLTMPEVIGPEAETQHLIGPRIEPPHQIDIVLEALA